MLETRDAYFWATHAGAELDLMVTVGGKRHGFEFKYADAPGTSRSMHSAIHDLSLNHLWVMYPAIRNTRLQIRFLLFLSIPYAHVSEIQNDKFQSSMQMKFK